MKEGLFHALLKLLSVSKWGLTCLKGCLSYIFFFIISILTPYKDMIFAICILSVIDWVLAVVNAIRRQNIQSTKMLGLVGKLIMYGIGFLIAGSFKLYADIVVFEYMITTSIILAEAISLIGNMMLVWPKSPILKLLDNFMKSELANKLGVAKEEVDKEIKKSKK